MRLYSQAEAYGRLPSEILRLQTDWGAWQLNEITLMVGRRVEKNLSEGKQAFYGFVQDVANRARGYRSVKSRVTKRVKIRPDGTW